MKEPELGPVAAPRTGDFRARLLRLFRRFVLTLSGSLLLWVLLAAGIDVYGRTGPPRGSWDAIVVAGATVWPGGRPSKALTRRTLGGVELWRSGLAPRLVLTGGVMRSEYAEARVAAQVARAEGVPESALVIEDRSQSTLENARFTRELIGDRRVLVVTDPYHVLRSQLIYACFFDEAQIVGLDVGKAPLWSNALREVPALLWFFITAVKECT